LKCHLLIRNGTTRSAKMERDETVRINLAHTVTFDASAGELPTA
jgi:hypothetical protein